MSEHNKAEQPVSVSQGEIFFLTFQLILNKGYTPQPEKNTC